MRSVATRQAARPAPVVTPAHGVPNVRAATLGSGHLSVTFSSALSSALASLSAVFGSVVQSVPSGSLPAETLSLHFWIVFKRARAYFTLSFPAAFWQAICGSPTAPPPS